ncbi:MAG: hypothetical protein O7E52_24330 [Candidatus Poribacteria bacterium]|nr:hypothetical protein [Candidatus Poribacteria bacterium]
MSQLVTLKLPDSIYARFKRMAEATEQPVEEAVMKSLTASLPPSVDDVPLEVQPELIALERLNDTVLWEVAQSTMSKYKLRKWKRLMDTNQERTLTDEEQHKLNAFVTEANRLALRKAHAYAVLKWRGHSLPTLEQIQEK